MESGTTAPPWVAKAAAYFGMRPSFAPFGLAFSFCWCYATQRLASNNLEGAFPIVQYIATALSCIAFALVARASSRSLSGSKGCLAVGLGMTVLAAVLTVFPGPWSSSEFVMAMVSVLTGTVIAWLYLSWGRFFARLDIRQAVACIGGTLVVSSLVKLFTDVLSNDVAGTMVVAVLPVVSLACLRAAPSSLAAQEAPERASSEVAPRSLMGIAAGFAVLAVCSGMFMALTAGVFELPTLYRVAAQMTTIVVGVGILGWAYVSPDSFTASGLWYIVVALVATGLALGVVIGLPLGNLSSAIFTAAQMAVIAFWWLVLSDVSQRGDRPSDAVFGLGWGLIYAAPMGIGLLLPGTVLPMDPQSLAIVALWMLIMVFFLTGTGSVALRPRLFWGLVPQVSMAEGAPLGQRVQEVGLSCGLTERECAVIELYAQGCTRSAIAVRLVITENTVRDHIRNAYRKLGVHSKQELVGLLEDERPSV